MYKFWIIAFFCLGFIYRLWLINLFPQPFVFDQTQYEEYAREMLKHGLYAHPFRIYGYPLFIALIYQFTGIVTTISKLPWQLFQVILDTLTAVLVYIVARRIFKIRKIADFAYVLYLFNPFTASFPGVLLPEVLTIFLMTLLFTFLSFSLKKITFLKLVILGIILGYLPQVRPFYLFYSLIVVFILVVIWFKKLLPIRYKIVGMVLLLLCYSLPFTYNVFGNLRYFGEFALMDVDNLFIENFYISLFLERSPDIKMSIWDYPPEVRWAFESYSYYTDPKDKVVRQAKKMLFLKMTMQEISKDPYKFLSWRVKKLWYAWEKHTLYLYLNPKSQLLASFIYWSNVAILLFAVVGLISYGKKVVNDRDISHKLFFIFSVLLFLNTSAVGAATSAQERYSLPAYPLVFIFCVFGIWITVNKLKYDSKKLIKLKHV